MTLVYAAFGSNLHPARLGRRTPSARFLGTLHKPGWRLAWHKVGSDGSGKCDLVESGAPGDEAYLALYQVDPHEKPVLDAVEGVGHGYRNVSWMLDDGREVHLYLAEKDYIVPSLKPFAWYHRFVIEGADHHKFPESYLETIRSVPVTLDPDRERARMNAAVLD